MKITSADFRANNEVLFKAKILKSDPTECVVTDPSVQWSEREFGAADVIDIDHDKAPGIEETEDTHHDEEEKQLVTSREQRYTEPCLAGGLDELKAQASKKGTEVLRGAELRGALVGHIVTDYQCSEWYDGDPWAESYTSPEETCDQWTIGQRSLQSLAAELLPEHPKARVAIDVKRGEFLIYK